MSLEQTLGEGATEAFASAVTFTDDQPSIVYGDYEDTPPWLEGINIEAPSHEPWPGPGMWRLATVLWENSTQQMYFQDGIMYWGNGICGNGGLDSDTMYLLNRLGNSNMKQFFLSYISEMHIVLPDLEHFYQPFYNAGFERTVIDSNAKMSVVISPTCRNIQWIDWLEAGADPATEPEWRV